MEKYYSKIRSHDVKNFTKCNITINVDSRLILHSQAIKGQRQDVKYAIASIQSLKKYNPKFIIADKAYGANAIRTCKNEEIKVSDKIPSNPTSDILVQKIKHEKIQKKTYSRKNNVKSIFGIIKRKYS